ncbi:hypothetical protein [Aneurinibacillus terranovensis]|uniref:hypothetical protein n=1 Tax=Aneurinibacillus terranovensis TaxID=278991 RepID=UPI0003F88B53|nr:hypothetical protein [Aneurinibacillus terranovensis]
MEKNKTKWFDLRFLVGILFTIYGVILIVYGAVANPQSKIKQVGNLDLWWGIVTLVFGLTFWLISRRPQTAKKKLDADYGESI